ncbi:MAG: nucleoside transporter C-terminal domain-containing protein, partial [Myxococcota bacterium]
PDGCAPDSVANDALMGCIAAMQEGAGADLFTLPVLTLQKVVGYLFAPFAFAMGVPWQDCFLIGQLLGEKMIANELVAYTTLHSFIADPSIQLADRSVIIATYALCGFANMASIGIQIGGIGGIAPSRKGDLARIAFRAMLAGTLAAFMTGTIAGILV